jgi:hypothetical protein
MPNPARLGPLAIVLAAVLIVSCNRGGGGTGTAPAAAVSYATNFVGTENPISEGRVWRHTGAAWAFVVKANGRAHGTQTGSGGYDDSYAYLSGFPPDQSASATLFLNPYAPTDNNREVELLLRWSDSRDRATGYECNLHYNGGYVQIVRWNGPLGDFTVLASAARPPKPKTGDVMKATIVGNAITVFYNGRPIVQTTDSTFPTGNPGIGFFIRSPAANDEFGFTSFAATGT